MRFMLTATWKQPLDETMMALLPAEEARADELAEQGILEAFSREPNSPYWDEAGE